MTRFRVTLPLALTVLLAAAAALHAIAQARVWGTIKDENGKPVADVKITVTLAESSFRSQETSDAKGGFALTLVDATRTYTYTLEKDGYQTISQNLKVGIGTNERHDFEIISLDEARRRGPTGRDLTPESRAVLIYNEGTEAFGMGDLATARSKFQESVTLNPNLDMGFLALAKLNYQEKKYPQAIEMAEKSIAIQPKNSEAHLLRIKALEIVGDSAALEAAKKQLAEVDSTARELLDIDSAYGDGIKEYNAGNTEKALELFQKVVAGKPDYAKAHYMLGLCLSGSDAAKAKEHFETFLRLAPDDPDAATAREMLKYLK